MNLHLVCHFRRRQGRAGAFIEQPARHHVHVVADLSQIKSQVRKELACRGVIGEEESVDEDDFQTDVPWLDSLLRCTKKSPSTNTSIVVRKKQSSASCGLQTTGSFSLKEVFSTIGIPVSARKLSIKKWYLGLVERDTVCRRPEPSTCVTAGISV